MSFGSSNKEHQAAIRFHRGNAESALDLAERKLENGYCAEAFRTLLVASSDIGKCQAHAERSDASRRDVQVAKAQERAAEMEARVNENTKRLFARCSVQSRVGKWSSRPRLVRGGR